MALTTIVLITSDIKKPTIHEMNADEVSFVSRVERVALSVKISRIIIIYSLTKYRIISVLRVTYNYNNNFR